MRKMLLIMLFALLAAGCGETGARTSPTHTAASPPAATSDESRARRLVSSWLDDLKSGGNGKFYWYSGPDAAVTVFPLRLNAVQSYKILSAETRPASSSEHDMRGGTTKACNVVVQVSHGDGAGHPVTNNYLLYTYEYGHGTWKIGGSARK
jgi:hypothetical protein